MQKTYFQKGQLYNVIHPLSSYNSCSFSFYKNKQVGTLVLIDFLLWGVAWGIYHLFLFSSLLKINIQYVLCAVIYHITYVYCVTIPDFTILLKKKKGMLLKLNRNKMCALLEIKCKMI